MNTGLSNQKQDLILSLVTNRITEDEFLKAYRLDLSNNFLLLNTLLCEAQQLKNGKNLELILLLGFHFGVNPICNEILCRLLIEEWHYQHENIAQTLDELRNPSSVPYLFTAAQMELEYLKISDSNPLAVKCIWALKKIGTDEAKRMLQRLTLSVNNVIAECAAKRLRDLNLEPAAPIGDA